MDHGLLFIDKEAGVTSRFVDNQIQRLFHTRKVGHLGTLDPFATGLLIVAVGSSTKYLPFLPDEEKTYEAVLRLGVKTDTADLTGTIIEEKEAPNLDKNQIEAVLQSFLGKSTQIPPMTSAIKKDGVALYKLAHKGEEVEREPRPIEIYDIKLLDYSSMEIRFQATVSKGTYIRVLGEDIATALGTIGHLLSLRRLAVGTIGLEGSIPLDEAGEKDLRPAADYVPYKHIELNDEEAKKARNGVALKFDLSDVRILLTHEGNPLAIYEKCGELYKCLRGL